MNSADRIEADGERKQVTVLFADVMGSMDMAEQHDPEQWRRIMQGFFSILAEEVRRFEGTVDKFTGDGIMAVFGAPVADESGDLHLRIAVRAAGAYAFLCAGDFDEAIEVAAWASEIAAGAT